MQIAETKNEGLARAYNVTIPASEIESRVAAEVKRIAPQVKMPGFRPGKVPANLVRKMHGEALHADALNNVVRESVDKVVAEHKLRPAMQPTVALGDGYEQGKDAEVGIELEVLPKVEVPSLDGLKLEKLVVPVGDAQMDEALERIATQQKSFEPAAEAKKAEDGDQLIIDFVGKLDGEPFEGGAGEDQALELGAGRFIPGFEEQLLDVVAGEEKTITVKFPDEYPAENLKGQEATFDVTVKEVKVPSQTRVDDDFAKSLGLEGLDKLKELLRGQLQQETDGMTRTQMKRALLDQLAAGHDFEVPPAMVEAEFQQIWSQLEQEANREEDPQAALDELAAEREDYRRIAQRRVRLGLLLSEIGQANGVEVSGQEMSMLIQQAAQQYRPEDRDRFVQYVRQDPMAAAQLRAPLYEDKVVDFLFDKAEVTEREVTRDELQAAIEADEADASKDAPAGEEQADASDSDAKAKKPAAAQKGGAKKSAAKPAGEGDTPASNAKPESDDKDAEAAPVKKKAATKKPAAKKTAE
ncbi:trigger factor [Croceicoccus sp. F390]|uniref:Trigger factor n=1 Tax=Croceicoccus esteveae TaxID=3075597 RepID=A0ABU2ZG40_9SPHN|nr:trigger factor [Croceicoccus sp. F390]MDT0575557.1 trigger factor [Croceicoccus sp. F390]